MTTPDLTPNDLQSILHFTVALARKAGGIMLEGSNAIHSIDQKKNSADLVTEYDVKVEALIKAEIAKAYPEFML